MLVVANLMVLAWSALRPDPHTRSAERIEALQINPGRVKLVGAATRGPGGQSGSGQSAIYRACLEWGPFSGLETGKAEAALARLELDTPPLQRTVGEAGGAKRYAYFVREPEAEVVARIAELQRAFPGTAIKAGPCP